MDQVFRLKYAQAATVAKTLTDLFNGPKPVDAEDSSAFRIVADNATNSLIAISSTPSKVEIIKQLLVEVLDTLEAAPKSR